MKSIESCLRRLRFAFGVFIGLTSCFAIRSTMGTELPILIRTGSSLGEAFDVPSRVPWIQTAIHLEKGEWYRITAVESCCFKDSFIKCTVNGPKGISGGVFDRLVRSPSRLNLFKYIGPGKTKRLRVLRDQTEQRRRASFLTLIASIGKDDSEEGAIVIGGDRTFLAPKSGTLYLFCNDWPGGVGLDEEMRFRNPAKSGPKALPTYGNNQGHLNVTVSKVSQPR